MTLLVPIFRTQQRSGNRSGTHLNFGVTSSSSLKITLATQRRVSTRSSALAWVDSSRQHSLAPFAALTCNILLHPQYATFLLKSRAVTHRKSSHKIQNIGPPIQPT